MQTFGKIAFALVLVAMGSFGVAAQQTNTEKAKPAKPLQYDEIIIKKKGDKDANVTIEIKDGEVTVNGKPMNDFKDEDLTIIRRKMNLGRGGDINFKVLPYREHVKPFDKEELKRMMPNFDIQTMPGMEGFRGFNMIMDRGPRFGIKAQDTDDGKGTRVLDVDDESNAAKAGLKEGDIITSFDGKSIKNTEELMEAAKTAKDKSSVSVNIRRDGKNQSLEIKVPKKLKTATL